ncbi:hypothetical protein HAX54_033477 [Datura stramonium]|uniref:Uncharacterized protein n=1 Tax=Datura stramonium TaxID=4076 RepID=A0ABS8SDF4_DATST|nr:hypothetical protein [Datura stramonium]
MATYLFGLCVLGGFVVPCMIHRTPTPTQDSRGRQVSSEGAVCASMLLIGAFSFLNHLDVDMILQTKIEAAIIGDSHRKIAATELRTTAETREYEKSWKKGKGGCLRSKLGQPSEKNINLGRVYRRATDMSVDGHYLCRSTDLELAIDWSLADRHRHFIG